MTENKIDSILFNKNSCIKWKKPVGIIENTVITCYIFFPSKPFHFLMNVFFYFFFCLPIWIFLYNFWAAPFFRCLSFFTCFTFFFRRYFAIYLFSPLFHVSFSLLLFFHWHYYYCPFFVCIVHRSETLKTTNSFPSYLMSREWVKEKKSKNLARKNGIRNVGGICKIKIYDRDKEWRRRTRRRNR